ncbi:T9SS type A sorting domain-containing protein [Fluviicola sp.]|uniref:T9SS type A sorting domain-containing protein n=1 Tax=Fluviicola sp. TaxID=1917219 RepID=UPI0031E3D557
MYLRPFLVIACIFQFGQAYTQNYYLVWQDDFNNPVLDTSKWTIETGTGVNGDWGTGQIDRATDRPENISITDTVSGASGSCLVLTSRKENYIDREYTSGRINTAGKFSWGPGHRIVARVKPKDVRFMGQGFAFWMLPDETPADTNYIMWPQGGEIDIMEYVGAIPYHNLGSVHYAYDWANNEWQSWNHAHQGFYYSYETEQVPDPSEPGYGNYPPPLGAMFAGSSAFHDYGIDWFDDRIEFFIDSTVYHIHYFEDGSEFALDGQDESDISVIGGKRVGESEYSNHFPEWHPFEHQMYLILSTGVGGSANTYGGPIQSNADFPCSIFIDWVKVYSTEQPNTATIAEIAVTPDFTLVPNPANTSMQIRGDKSVAHFQILDAAGKPVLEGDKTNVAVSSLENGLYFIQITTSQGIIQTKTFIKD